jgi:hypothetical protein
MTGTRSLNIYAPIFWPNAPGIDHRAATLALDALLPAAGSTTLAFFDQQDALHVGDAIGVIWCPTVSDLNGWSEQPSEIAASYLLSATVVSAGRAAQPSARDPNFIHRGKLEYDLQIHSRDRLIPALQATQPDSGAWRLQAIGTPNGSLLAWDEIVWAGQATVEGLIYLAATTGHETYLELLIEPDGEAFTGLFSLHMSPGGTDYGLGRRHFSSDELRAVRHALALAKPLHDTQPAYLTAGE